jgi:hypothetical protein
MTSANFSQSSVIHLSFCSQNIKIVVLTKYRGAFYHHHAHNLK